MRPFAGAPPPPQKNNPAEPDIVTLNVGGRIFQTTPQTLSLLPALPTAVAGAGFVDRDPQLFSILLSLLRTGRLPAAAATVDLRDLAAEARFYGLDESLLAVDFSPFDLRPRSAVQFPGRDRPSAIAADTRGGVLVAHGSKITSLDWTLRRKTTLLTSFPAVDSLLSLSPAAVAAGAADFPGLRILPLSDNSAKTTTLHWESSSTVLGIETSPELLFVSFEASRRNASAVVAYDLAGGTLLPTTEIGRREVYGADLLSAVPAGKLRWAPQKGLLMAAGAHNGPAGRNGVVRLWDVRLKVPVWESTESVDCFADVTVVDRLDSLVKVGVDSGELYVADMRKLDVENAWRCVGDEKKAVSRKREGAGCKVESHGGWVFCSRGADVEVWSEVVVNGGDRVMRKNVLGKGEGGKIELMAFGGARMVLARKGTRSVEIWEC